MVPQRLSIGTGLGFLTTDEITHFLARHAIHSPLAVTHANRRQVGPGVGVANATGLTQDQVTAILVPTVSMLTRFIGIMLDTGKILFRGIGQCLLNVREQMFLVVLDREDV